MLVKDTLDKLTSKLLKSDKVNKPLVNEHWRYQADSFLVKQFSASTAARVEARLMCRNQAYRTRK